MDIRQFLDKYIIKFNVKADISFNMPKGYEKAFGTYDRELNTLFINNKISDEKKLFFALHEFWHLVQIKRDDLFCDNIKKSLDYVILCDGTFFRFIENKYVEGKLKNQPQYFMDIYSNLPYEIDANKFAFNECKKYIKDKDIIAQIQKIITPTNVAIPKSKIKSEIEKVFKEIDLIINIDKNS